MVDHPNPWRQSSLNKPMFRGWLHTAMLPASVVAGVALVATARSFATGVAAGIFALSVTMMFFTSTVFNRQWFNDKGWEIARKVDQTAIYGLIVGSYTGLVGVSADDDVRWLALAAVWILAGAGIALRWGSFTMPLGLQSGLFVLLGVVAGLGIFALLADGREQTSVLVALGGACYIVGVIILGLRRPDPSPKYFGYHEIWHVLVVAALVFHFLAVRDVVA